MLRKLVLFVALCLGSANVLPAATYYVSTSGSDSNNGSQGSPWRSIQKAANTVNAGDVVNIANGNYAEYVNVTRSGSASAPITFSGWATNIGWKLQARWIVLTNIATDAAVGNIGFTSSEGWVTPMNLGEDPSDFNVIDSCSINGRGNFWVGVQFGRQAAGFSAGASNTVRRTTIRNFGNKWSVMRGNHNVFENCTFVGDMAGASGDVIYVMGQYNTFRSNEVYGVRYDDGLHTDIFQNWSGAYNYNLVEGNYIHDCDAQITSIVDYGGGAHDMIFRNNIFKNITRPAFCGIRNMYWHNNLFINCRNTSRLATLLFYQDASDDSTGSQVINNMFIDCDNAASAGAGVTVSHNYGATALFGATGWGGGLGANSVDGGNPQFVNAAAGNYHLRSDSPLINKGTPIAGLVVDRDGVKRPQGAGWDIGPYEYTTGGPSTNPVVMVSPSSVDFGSIAVGTTKSLTVTVRNVGGGSLAGTVTVAAPFSIVGSGTYTLGSDQSQTVTIRYSPTAAGSSSQTVTFSGGGGTTVTVVGVAWTPLSGLSFEANAGIVMAPFAASASYISQSGFTGVLDGGRAVYGFNIVNAGDYTVSANVIAPDSSANSVFLNIDSDPLDPTGIWDMQVSTGATSQVASWRGVGDDGAPQYAPKIFTLAAGTHQLTIVGREGGAQVGRITIAPYSAVRPPSPQNLHVVGSP